MNSQQRFLGYLAECPLIAILRGVRPDEVEGIGEALYEAGIRVIEVPLNSPEPLDSIARLSARLGSRALIGAGTVLTTDDVEAVRAVGGQIAVSPSTRADVIAATVDSGMVSCPGYFTPSEAFAAIDAGAHALKLFPAEGTSPAVLRAQRAVLPNHVPLLVVGGVAVDAMAAWRAAGADGFGLGSGVYRPGEAPADTLTKARAYVAALARR